MYRSIKWALPVTAAVGLLIGLAAMSAQAQDVQKGTITGKVVDKDGKAVADARVMLTKPRTRGAAPQAQQPRQRPEPLATATTGADGTFKLEFDKSKVPDGDYNVICFAQGKGMAREKVTIKGTTATPAEVSLKLQEMRRGGGAGGAGGGAQ